MIICQTRPEHSERESLPGHGLDHSHEKAHIGSRDQQPLWLAAQDVTNGGRHFKEKMDADPNVRILQKEGKMYLEG